MAWFVRATGWGGGALYLHRQDTRNLKNTRKKRSCLRQILSFDALADDTIESVYVPFRLPEKILKALFTVYCPAGWI